LTSPASTTAAAVPFGLSGLRAGGDNQLEELRNLLAHTDPKGRTLAIVLLFDLERVDILADVAALVGDVAETFAEPSPFASALDFNRPTSRPMRRATVGQYARAVIDRYVAASYELSRQREAGLLSDADPASLAARLRGFAAARDPKFCTAALRVAMERATGAISPLQPDRVPRVQAVLDSLERVPMPRRFFVALALEFERYHGERYAPGYLLDMARRVPRESRLAALRGHSAVDDPDLEPGFGCDYFLDHAADLFRASDFELLVELGTGKVRRGLNTMHPDGLSDAKYLVAAAMLRTDQADAILIPAIARFNGEHDGEQRQQLATALAQYGSDQGVRAAIDWFFREPPQPGAFGFGREAFLERLRARAPVRHRAVVARIVCDERLPTLGPASTRLLLTSAEGYLGRSLAEEEHVRSSYGIDEFQRDRKFEHLADWQRLLRQTVDEWDR
jgi:hypothetical protein